jgi:hypothetical protein
MGSLGCEMATLGCEMEILGCEMTNLGCEMDTLGCETDSLGSEAAMMGSLRPFSRRGICIGTLVLWSRPGTTQLFETVPMEPCTHPLAAVARHSSDQC